ncbi:hypothetical protein AJ85_08635 [Alkalihalobacillus alcalophilus ATCC 27647 = CGMCC 1.3604]|uniref:Uncharacterized protein n=1 Tax=Alkalihalobacillus alcalophilus ATCC 27647 = CGMCC 1.3604 TaxID=1218173 RepID=A0A4V3X8M0_ALKAL|nr:DUF6241 domain-containing protein [Alkalihalobacillus alcalophilus]MED1562246.1 DUF6241 domain-containing protein [Alkalihalobacillus alcalophilus]THG90832.1 hypothetical protein AJ85_08635 [Alkalihalobacillus alcalophilus ATCC 27647 = CGMCC 1.3604]
MKKPFVVMIILVAVGAIIYFPFYQNSEEAGSAESKEPIETAAVNTEETVEDESEPIIQAIEGEDIEALLPLSMTEESVQNRIHHMSHGYIHARQKWGKFEVTKERLGRLIEVIEENDYENEELYLEILTRWTDGDFSNAVEDHNAIWRLQNGTVGEALRLLSADEREKYQEQHFGGKE